MEQQPFDELFNQALAFKAKGDIGKAKRSIEQALRLHPKQPYALALFKRICLIEKAKR